MLEIYSYSIILDFDNIFHVYGKNECGYMPLCDGYGKIEKYSTLYENLQSDDVRCLLVNFANKGRKICPDCLVKIYNIGVKK